MEIAAPAVQLQTQDRGACLPLRLHERIANAILYIDLALQDGGYNTLTILLSDFLYPECNGPQWRLITEALPAAFPVIPHSMHIAQCSCHCPDSFSHCTTFSFHLVSRPFNDMLARHHGGRASSKTLSIGCYCAGSD